MSCSWRALRGGERQLVRSLLGRGTVSTDGCAARRPPTPPSPSDVEFVLGPGRQCCKTHLLDESSASRCGGLDRPSPRQGSSLTLVQDNAQPPAFMRVR